MMSWIEKHAFSVLLRQETASIKDMRPVDVPANQFAYHLNSLIQQGYVQKIGRGAYSLTAIGLRAIGTMSTLTGESRDTIKTVIILYGKAEDGRTALFEWSRQPYIHTVTLPHDRMAYGVTLDDAVANACIDKLGQKISVQFKTSAFITITHEDHIVSRMHGLVYSFDPHDITFPHYARNGTLRLQKLGECDNLMTGVEYFIAKLDAVADVTPLEVTFTY
jgi:hypothetical protein